MGRAVRSALLALTSVVVIAAAAIFVRGSARRSAEPGGAPVASATASGVASPVTCAITETPIPIPLGDAEMAPICDGVYAEPGITPAEVAELQRAHETARQNLAHAFGQATRSSPLTLFCHTASCKVAFGAAPAAANAKDLGFARDAVNTKSGPIARSIVVVTGPVSASARILTHELVHAEMKAWVPYDSLPTWFNEGMATLVAGEPNCNGRPRATDFDVTRLATKAAWEGHLRSGGDTLETYCLARREVAAWAARFGGDEPRAVALKRLMTQVAEGVSFERAYSP
jgi:hypothetical protein